MMKKSEKICWKEKDAAEQVKDDAGQGKDAAGQGKYAAGRGIDIAGQGKDLIVIGHLCIGECRSLVRIDKTNGSVRLIRLGKLPSLRWDKGWQCGVWRGEGS